LTLNQRSTKRCRLRSRKHGRRRRSRGLFALLVFLLFFLSLLFFLRLAVRFRGELLLFLFLGGLFRLAVFTLLLQAFFLFGLFLRLLLREGLLLLLLDWVGGGD